MDKCINLFYIVLFIFYLKILTVVNCAIIGMMSPIEVVEEWGCLDTEIRLTCGHIESRIAILEAKLMPNCSTFGQNDTCLHLDEYHISRTYSAQKIDQLSLEESEAGRRFLETLRRNHIKEKEAEMESNTVAGSSNNNVAISVKDKKSSLRATLERMIVRFLQRSPNDEGETDYEDNEIIRRKRENSNNSTDNDDNDDFDSDDYDDIGENDAVSSENSVENSTTLNNNTVSGEYNSTEANLVSSASDVNDSVKNMELVVEKKSKSKENDGCSGIRKRVSQLDRYELEKSLKADVAQELNIRSALNYRCSGKNHCSFIFSQDHALAAVWKEGIVRIKYVCMDDFRINKYCGEHLIIGNELQHRKSKSHEKLRKTNQYLHDADYTGDDEGGFEEPRAEARVQNDLPVLHQPKLKILKLSPTQESVEAERKLAEELELEQSKYRQKQKVFSQDFKFLKVIPSSIDKVEDIKKIGNELYFKKDDGEATYDVEKNVIDADIARDNDDVDAVKPITEDISNEVFPTSNILIDLLEKTTYMRVSEMKNNEKEKGLSSSTPMPEIVNNLNIILKDNVGLPTDAETTTKTTETNHTTFSPVILRIDAAEVPPNINNLADTDGQGIRIDHAATTVSTFVFNNKSFDEMYENIKNEYDKDSETKITDQDRERDGEDDGEDDDDEDDDDDSDDYWDKKHGIVKYSSIQRTLMKRPLLQGFIMTPGYPEYYVGDLTCKWTIYASSGQKVVITIFDLALRSDEVCRDYVEIIDLRLKTTLFNSCTEINQPVQIISQSNHVEINVKTTTKVAYPKRGVLIHYSALGCELPSTPPHANLVRRTEQHAKYVCDPLYVFPDSIEASREIFCTNKHTWDKSLPDCVEKRATEGSGLVSHYEQKRKISDFTMTDKKADTVYDILIPSMIIAGLFIVNGIIFAVIMRYRNKRKQRLQIENKELAEL